MNRLRELREAKKYTLDDIEKKTGINRGTYNNYESGKTSPKEPTWQALANFFNVSVDYLKGYGYSKDYIYKQLNDAYKEDYLLTFELEPPFTSPFISARDEIKNYCKQNKISIPKDTDLDFWKTNFNFIFKDKSVNRLLTTKDKYSDSDIKELIINAIYWYGLNPHTRELVNKLSHNS
ncbi:helix-turn-helix transcriptional regulator [Lactobacillus amylovorus]|uniref:Helix-turn-helix transcriptional regulator n=1 Tax=Lactobacillus amylovorus TaxID=1604 RepID=A0A9X3W8B8_LACAM|nr:helix-turn-helix transcriptional regulator [Lactobacillus amylovorus]MDB6254849.1 helix-turn-helix transcriptional regulator [Lactobacillus amylovorus]MDB6259067.1 helix-turn-helix transcriptional regulator [Lactobacillus amylovorus]